YCRVAAQPGAEFPRGDDARLTVCWPVSAEVGLGFSDGALGHRVGALSRPCPPAAWDACTFVLIHQRIWNAVGARGLGFLQISGAGRPRSSRLRSVSEFGIPSVARAAR